MTKDETTEADEVRAMLHRRAADVTPSPAAWEAITARLGAGDAPVDAPVIPLRRTGDGGRDTRRRRLLAGAAAAAVVAAAVGSAVLLGGGDDDGSLIAGEGDAPTTTVAPAPAGDLPIPGVWPSGTVQDLLEHPDATTVLADPQAAALQYLAERLPIGTGTVSEPVERTGEGSAQMRWDTAGDAPAAGGEVFLRQIDRDGPWYVVAAASDVLEVAPSEEGDEPGSRSFSVTAAVSGAAEVDARRPGEPDTGPGDGPEAGGELQAGEALAFTFGSGDEAFVLRTLLLDPDGALLGFAEALFEAAPDGSKDEAPAATAPATTVPPAATEPSEPARPIDEGAAVGETTVVITADGLGFLGAGDDTSMRRLDFGVPLAEVVEALTRSLGEPITTAEDTECGLGPTDRAIFPNGVSVDGRDGAFTSWALNAPSDLSDAAGVGIGTTVAELHEVYVDMTVEETTLGWELVGEPYGGIVRGPADGDVVEVLWGGEPCIFR